MDEVEIKRLSAILDAHGQFEVERDLDATMTTVSANPMYELPSAGWKVEGRDAVRELYRRFFASADGKVLSAETRVVAATDDNVLVHEGYTVRQAPDGSTRQSRSATVVLFDGDLVAGERIYSDGYQAQLHREALGDDFGDVPGVTRL